jgi:CheY-like chemotaxis protein
MNHEVLLVDPERRSARVLSVALRCAGYRVRVAVDGVDGLERLKEATPDVIVSDSRLPQLDTFAFLDRVRQSPQAAQVPVVLMTGRGAADDRERGSAFGVAEYLAKPVFLRELVACVDLVIARNARGAAARALASRSDRFVGSTHELSVVDLFHTFETIRASGVVHLGRSSATGEIHFRDGRAVDARSGRIRGEPAVYAMLAWTDAEFEIDFRPVTCEDVIDRSTGTLLSEGMRRVDEWARIREQLRPLAELVEVDSTRLLTQVVGRLAAGRALSADDDGVAPSVLADAVQSLRSSRPPPDQDDGGSDEAVAAARSPRDSESDPSPDASGRSAFGQTQRFEGPGKSSVPSSPPRPMAPEQAMIRARAPSPTPPMGGTTRATTRVVAPPPARAPEHKPEAPVQPPSPQAASGLSGDIVPGDEEPFPMTREPSPVQPDVAIAVSSYVAAGSPSSPPWTREVAADSEIPDLGQDSGHAAGVPRAISPRAKRVVAGAVAVATVLCVAAGVQAWSTQQQRRAEEAAWRGGSAAAVAAPATSVPWRPVELPPPPSASTAEPVALAPVPSETPVPSAQPEPQPRDVSRASPASNDVGVARAAAPPATPDVVPVSPGAQPALVKAAEEALLRGAIDRAVELASKAVAANPENAESWLTLAAAHKAAHDLAAARQDYRSCIAHAVTEGVTHCRVLASR